MALITWSYTNHDTDKEVEGYYEAGMRVPDDVVLLWSDDKYVSTSSPRAHFLISFEVGEMSVATLYPASATAPGALVFTTISTMLATLVITSGSRYACVGIASMRFGPNTSVRQSSQIEHVMTPFIVMLRSPY